MSNSGRASRPWSEKGTAEAGAPRTARQVER